MNPGPRWWWPVHPAGATLSYALIALAFTWPLATGLGHLVPWDLGDSLLNDWILAWHYHQAGLVLTGDWSAWSAWWHPPIFHPARYTIGYSELLITQAVLGAPVHALTGNLLLTYNVLFLGSFVLSGLGGFLLVRDLTGDARAGWLAGLLYGFALYRVTQGPHLQVLHAQWAPFVLWLLHRWFTHGRWRDAALGGLALAAQNLSNGYYLFYLALLLPPWVVGQLAARRRLADVRGWLGPAVTALVAAALTLPFLYPYLQLRAEGQGARPLASVAYYGADTFAWLTANDQLRVWGWLRTRPHPEGDLFPGLIPLTLAAAGLALTLHRRVRDSATRPSRPTARTWLVRARRVVAIGAATLAAWQTAAIGLALFGGVSRFTLGPVVVSISDGSRLLLLWAMAMTTLLAASRRAREAVADQPHAPVVLLAALTAFTVWLSFGPVIRIGQRPSSSWPEIYSLLYAGLPGGDALRVPPRVAMMTALLLAMLSGIGVAALRRAGRMPDAVLAGVAVLFLAEAWPAPIPVNATMHARGLAQTPATVPARPADDATARLLARLPADAVLVDLPIGSPPWEIRWQYLSAGHWRARLNGYSGGFPHDHLVVEHVLGALPERSAEAAVLLAERGVTHVVLHPQVWLDETSPVAIREWLRTLGATPIVEHDDLEVWRLRAPVAH